MNPRTILYSASFSLFVFAPTFAHSEPQKWVYAAQKNGDRISFDFSNTNLMNYCGQLATIAASLTVVKGSRHCESVVQQ